MEKISGIVKASTRVTWKSDLPEKPLRSSGEFNPAMSIEAPKSALDMVKSQEELNQLVSEDPLRGKYINTVA